MTATIYTSIFFGGVNNDAVGAGSSYLENGDPENLLNGLTYNYWKPVAIGLSWNAGSFKFDHNKYINYFAFDAHNLVDSLDAGSIVKIQASVDDVFTTPVNISGDLDYNDIVEGANVLEFTQNTTGYMYWRIIITHPTAFTIQPYIGVLHMGRKTVLPEGVRPSYTPPRLGRKSDVLNNNSNTGNSIGRSLKRSRLVFNIKNELIDPAWINTNWLDLVKQIEEEPFFYLWNDLYPTDAVLAWTIGSIKPPRYTTANLMAFDFKCNGFQ